MRLAALFMLGPAVGLALTDLLFGLSPDLRLLASGMTLFALALLGVLVRAEARRLSGGRRP